MRRLTLFTCLSCLPALAAIASACGGSSSSPTTSPRPFNGSPSAVTQTPGAGGGTLSATAAPPIKIAASGIRYDQAQLMAAPGMITIEFDNNDANVTHNFAIYKSAADTSTPLGATPITSGPDRQTLRITLDQDEYYYQCEVHPQQMNGKLIVH